MAEAITQASEISTIATVATGIGTVFFGLICLIVIIQIMHALISKFYHADEKKPEEAPVRIQANDDSGIDHNTLVAIASAAVAEQLGKDVEAIRVVSIKKI